MKNIINKILKDIQARSFKFLSETLYYLPLFFLCLGQSPNFTEKGISHALLNCLLLIILLGSIKFWTQNKTESKIPVLVIGLAAFFIIAYLNYNFLTLVYLVLISIPVVYTGLRINTYLGEFLISCFIFTFAYLGINQYDPGQLWQGKFLLIMILAGFYFTAFISKSRSSWDFLLFLAGFALWTIYADTFSYFWVLPLAFVPRIIIQFRFPSKKILSDVLTGALLAVYFVYYFLFGNHVIQALTGGL